MICDRDWVTLLSPRDLSFQPFCPSEPLGWQEWAVPLQYRQLSPEVPTGASQEYPLVGRQAGQRAQGLPVPQPYASTTPPDWWGLEGWPEALGTHKAGRREQPSCCRSLGTYFGQEDVNRDGRN